MKKSHNNIVVRADKYIKIKIDVLFTIFLPNNILNDKSLKLTCFFIAYLDKYFK